LVARTLREIARAPTGTYFEVDIGGAGWAACELVALAFGYGGGAWNDHVLDIVAKLRPREEHRVLALEALPRIADPTSCELAGLWHEHVEGAARFEGALADLGSRLRAASAGPRQLPKPRAGDVIVLPAVSQSPGLVVVQVVGSGEIAVFEGSPPDETAALECVASRSARRVPTSVTSISRHGRLIGNRPVRRDLKGKKSYASEVSSLEHYSLSTASGGGLRIVAYEEARDADLFRLHDEDAFRAIALGTQPVERVRSPEQREAALRAEMADQWSARRSATTPGPFGDLVVLQDLLEWMEEFGVDNAVGRFLDEATGRQGYGRPNEHDERRSYAFAGMVALWCGGWPAAMWPESAGRLPAAPAELMVQALDAAGTLAGRLLTRDSELRLIWEDAPDGGAELHEIVASLQTALE
jgi:hypothetical protein